jgi:hypothetical protein
MDRRFDRLVAEARRRSVLLAGGFKSAPVIPRTKASPKRSTTPASFLRAGDSELRTLSAGEVTVAG